MFSPNSSDLQMTALATQKKCATVQHFQLRNCYLFRTGVSDQEPTGDLTGLTQGLVTREEMEGVELPGLLCQD